MARGIMYEITSETELENAGIFSLSEDDLLDFVGNAFDYCSDKDREEDVPEMMEYLQKFGLQKKLISQNHMMILWKKSRALQSRSLHPILLKLLI